MNLKSKHNWILQILDSSQFAKILIILTSFDEENFPLLINIRMCICNTFDNKYVKTNNKKNTQWNSQGLLFN